VEVSDCIREESENGRDCYRLHGQPAAAPADPRWLPSKDDLHCRAQDVFG